MSIYKDIPLHPEHRVRDLQYSMHHDLITQAALHRYDEQKSHNKYVAHVLVGASAFMLISASTQFPNISIDAEVMAEKVHNAASKPQQESLILKEEIINDNLTPSHKTDAPNTVYHQQQSNAISHSAVGIYLTGNSIARSDGFFETSLNAIAAMPSPTLVIDVKEGGIFYHTTSTLAQEIRSVHTKYDLTDAITEAKKHGIYVIARFVAAKDKPLASQRPETQIQHPITGRSVGSVWVDLSNPLVLAYNEELLREVVGAGVDEVNIDYIRYPTEYPLSAVGLTGKEKADHVETFILMARNVIDAINPNVKLGISTYAILGWEYPINLEHLGQDVIRFAPLVDIISPMAYPASFAEGYYYTGETNRSRNYELTYKTLKGYAELLGKDAWKLRPWIQGYRVSSKEMKDEIDAVFDAGLCGFTIWSPSNQYWPLFAISDDIMMPEACLSNI